MPTLNKTKNETLLILKWVGFSIGIIFLFLIAIRLAIFVKNVFAPPAAPEAKFGKLPAISFPEKNKENLTFVLDTVSGYLPVFSDRANVYKITTDQPTLLGLNGARKKIEKIGFISSGTQISDDTYQWINQDNDIQKRITMNIFSSDFSLSSSYLISQSLENFSNTGETNSAAEAAEEFLTSMSLFPSDIDKNKTKISIFSIKNNSLIQTSKISDTKIAKVDFMQNDLDNLPIYYDKGISSTMSFLIGKINKKLYVVEARFFHKNISESASDYGIKTSQEAYSELQKGKAYIANRTGDAEEFKIKKVFLAYYIGEEQQDYLMPIIVFEGNDDFIAYVSAVKDEWISN